MSGRVFIDTNLLIYLVSDVPDKKQRVEEILASDRAVISTHVVNEFISVCLKKALLTIDDLHDAVDVFFQTLDLTIVQQTTIERSLHLHSSLRFSYWDALILASALEHGCSLLYTEDMQHGQVIEGALTITNPFAP